MRSIAEVGKEQVRPRAVVLSSAGITLNTFHLLHFTFEMRLGSLVTLGLLFMIVPSFGYLQTSWCRLQRRIALANAETRFNCSAPDLVEDAAFTLGQMLNGFNGLQPLLVCQNGGWQWHGVPRCRPRSSSCVGGDIPQPLARFTCGCLAAGRDNDQIRRSWLC